ncbi:multicopper oxidase family protein [Actinomadura sp. HBU206391]|uniref:multicopper oxidase family protein n=1 Tax=Actinomadura sp. HBU206391 TaxID=2731692 RepID=UPI001650AF7F|nr:multicopper oxidase family protein [Actinomadura sp. HBU206391]MBC6463246.1 multicopper oxidase family protein [Actinomadura sp. HBU206391]
MTTIQWILLDHVAALVSVATWFAAGVTTALNRVRLGLGFLVAAVVAALIRVSTVVMLARAGGWWFAQEKVLLGLPMLAVTGLAAALIAGRPLLDARQAPDQVLPAGSVVALLTAAYAALAGLVVTFFVGYPLTWGVALITIAIVCLGALLTARAVAAKADDAAESAVDDDDPAAALTPDGRPRFSRRQVMTLAGRAVVVGAGSAGAGLSFLSAESVTTGGGPAHLPYHRPHVSVADLRGARKPAPGGATKRHVLTAQKATVRLPSGRELHAWTYAGQLPGPAIAATEGDLIEVTLRNADIDDGVTLHWHGYDIACGEDGAPGVTQHVVAPGEEFVYHFRADQVGTYWYHTHQASHEGVRKGLYGTLVVHPRAPRPRTAAAELDLTLPVHTFDDTVLIGDRDARADHTAAAGTPVRLRLLNTDSDPHRFALAGTAFRVAGVDGRDIDQPGEVSEVGLRLPAGGRYDLVFDMPDTSVALVVDNDRNGGVRLHTDRNSAAAEPAVDDTSDWPELDLLHYGEPAPMPFDGGHADRHFTLVLDRGVAMVDGRPAYAHTVNGRGHPSIPDQLVAEGDLVRFTVVNQSLETHPWHLHGHPVLILSRDGTRSSGSPLWVDTFDVRPGEVWEVAFKATNLGIWMNHCHNLPHAHQGMMLRLAYDGVGSPFGDAHTGHG